MASNAILTTNYYVDTTLTTNYGVRTGRDGRDGTDMASDATLTTYFGVRRHVRPVPS